MVKENPVRGLTNPRKIATVCLLAVLATVLPITVMAKQMMVTANPHASRAGMDMLLAGGSAVDAAIAAELVLSLVEPQSSGIGGGAFLLHYDAAAEQGHRIEAFDGRETAPADVGQDLFSGLERSRAGFMEAVLGGHSTGTPGLVAMLHLAHQKHGKLPWKDLFVPAIELSSDGFKVSQRLHFLLARDPLLKKVPQSFEYFYDKEGNARPVGYLLKNPDYANTLKLISEQGPEVFYRGEIAQQILSAVNNTAQNPGTLSAADLSSYQAKIRQAVCAPYRVYTICSMSPPSSGGIAVSSILGILSSFDLASMQPDDPNTIHLILEAERLAYADRDFYVADPDFVAIPVAGMLDPEYLGERAAMIDAKKSMGKAVHGSPPTTVPLAKHSLGFTPEIPSTSHMSIIDQWGNIVSMTATVESAFGNRHMVAGFMLNNELTDFTFFGNDPENPPANVPDGGKRPRSSMAPTIVLDQQGRPVFVTGSAGGNSIIAYVAQTIIGVLDWDMSVEAAINAPHFMSKNGPVTLEKDTAADKLKAPLEALGHKVRVRTMNSGLHGIRIRYDADGMATFEGGADKRREGLVLTL